MDGVRESPPEDHLAPCLRRPDVKCRNRRDGACASCPRDGDHPGQPAWRIFRQARAEGRSEAEVWADIVAGSYDTPAEDDADGVAAERGQRPHYDNEGHEI